MKMDKKEIFEELKEQERQLDELFARRKELKKELIDKYGQEAYNEMWFDLRYSF